MNQPFNNNDDLFGDLPAPKQKAAEVDPEPNKKLKVDSDAKQEVSAAESPADSSLPPSSPEVSGVSSHEPTLATVPPIPTPAPSCAPTPQWSVAVRAAHHGAKGRRKTMEDAHLCFDDAQLKALYEPPTGQEVPAGQPGVNHAKILSSALRLGLYGVLDGHGGRQVADLVAKVLPRYLVKELAALPSLPSPLANEVVGCCERAVAAADAESQQAARQNGWTDGCCCVLLLLVNDSCFVCNMGDSKAVLCRRRKVDPKKPPKGPPLTDDDVSGDSATGAAHRHSFPWTPRGPGAGYASTSSNMSSVSSSSNSSGSSGSGGSSAHATAPPAADALPLTADHTPLLVAERERIESCGGKVQNGRVNGALGVARSFGDVEFKRFGVVALPDLRAKFKVGTGDEFVLLACDGLWNRFSEASACAFVRQRLWAGTSWCGGHEHAWSLAKCAQALVHDAVHCKNAQDNVSVMAVAFKHPAQNLQPRVVE